MRYRGEEEGVGVGGGTHPSQVGGSPHLCDKNDHLKSNVYKQTDTKTHSGSSLKRHDSQILQTVAKQHSWFSLHNSDINVKSQ